MSILRRRARSTMPATRRPPGGPREVLLQPVNPLFIIFSLLVALLLNFLPLGRVSWRPDIVALVLVFWNVHHPRKVGMGAAFIIGLLVDVQQGAVLGQHALAYVLLSYFAISLHRRLLWFSPLTQALQILPLFAAAQVILLLVGMWAGGSFPGWGYAVSPFIEAALWPVATLLLLAPQRRPPDPDENRPL